MDHYKINLEVPRWHYRSVAQIRNTLMQHHLYASLQHILSLHHLLHVTSKSQPNKLILRNESVVSTVEV